MYGEFTVNMAAEVGLLSRNIKIIGHEYAKQDEENHGAKVLVGKMTHQDKATKKLTFYQGLCHWIAI